jgi:hypothetical protein
LQFFFGIIYRVFKKVTVGPASCGRLDRRSRGAAEVALYNTLATPNFILFYTGVICTTIQHSSNTIQHAGWINKKYIQTFLFPPFLSALPTA